MLAFSIMYSGLAEWSLVIYGLGPLLLIFGWNAKAPFFQLEQLQLSEACRGTSVCTRSRGPPAHSKACINPLKYVNGCFPKLCFLGALNLQSMEPAFENCPYLLWGHEWQAVEGRREANAESLAHLHPGSSNCESPTSPEPSHEYPKP